MDTRILSDLHDLIGKRLRQILGDHVDTCERAGLSPSDVAISIMSSMLFETTVAALRLRMSEAEFMSACQLSYRHLRVNAPEIYTKTKKGATK
jgi:hypothetical protein